MIFGVLTMIAGGAWQSAGAQEEKNLIFRAVYEKTLNAQVSKGSPRASVVPDDLAIVEEQGKKGVPIRGKAFLSYPGQGNFNPRQGTVLMRVKPDWAKAAGQYFISAWANEPFGAFLFFAYSDGSLQLRIWNKELMMNIGSDKFNVNGGKWQNEWHQVGFTYNLDSGLVQIVADGAVVGGATVKDMPDLAGRNYGLGIGCNYNTGTNQFNGLINEVNIYDTALKFGAAAAPAARPATEPQKKK